MRNRVLLLAGSILPQDNAALVVPMARKEEIVELTKHFPLPENKLAAGAQSSNSHFALYDRHKDRAAQLPLTLLSAKDYHGTQPHVFVLFQWRDTFRCLLYNIERKEIVEENGAERSRRLLDLLKCDEKESKAYVSAKTVESAAVESAAIEATQAWLAAPERQNEQQANEEDEQPPLLRLCAVYLNPIGKSGTKTTRLSDIFMEATSPEA